MLLGLYGVDLGFVNFGDAEHILGETFVLFALILAIHAMINIFRTHLLALINNISVFWHVLGVAVIIAILVFVPDDHQSLDFVFTERINNSGFGDGGRRPVLLVLRPAARLPADAVHDHRLRRLGAHLRGDPRRVEVGGARASGSRSSTRP